MNNNGFNKNNGDNNNLNDYNNNGQSFNNENNVINQNQAYDNANNQNIYNDQNQNVDNSFLSNNNVVNQNVSLTSGNTNDNNNLNDYNNNGQNFNNENNVINQNQAYDNANNQNFYNNQNVDNSFFGNDNSGNQEVNLTGENNDLHNYSISNSGKKKTSKSLIIIVVLSLSTLFWCFFIFIFVSSLNKTVDSTQKYLNDARVNTFLDDANSSISAVYLDVLWNEYKPYYSLNEINSLLDNKLTISPFGSKYKDSSCVKVINNNEISHGYDIQMCLIDEEGNGFTLTDQHEISNNSFKLKSLKNIECSCS